MLSTYKWSAMEFKSTYHSISIIRHYPFIWNCWETGMACLEEFVAYQRNPWFFIEECVKQKKKTKFKMLSNTDCFLHRLRLFPASFTKIHYLSFTKSKFIIKGNNFGCGCGRRLVLIIKELCLVDCIFAQDKAQQI